MTPQARLWKQCDRCQADLIPDGPDSIYQFDNALWIGFHGGYGMFVDNMEATMPINTEDQWLKDKHGEYLTAPGKDGKETLVPDLNWTPQFAEPRIVAGTPDYEAVICHECAHQLCDTEPWLDKLLTPFMSHSHKTSWKETHPGHDGWDYRSSEEVQAMMEKRKKRKKRKK